MKSETIILVQHETGVLIGALERGDDGKYVFWPGGGPERGSYSEQLLRWIAEAVRKANAGEPGGTMKYSGKRLG